VPARRDAILSTAPAEAPITVPEYRALGHYSGDTATGYDGRRFVSAKGSLVDDREWRLVEWGLSLLRARSSVETVVDVPAGTGRMSVRLTAAGYSVTALDTSSDMLEVARTKSAASHYVVGRVEELPLPDASVDAVVSVRLFGHLPDATKALALREFARVSRAGIVVLFVCDNPWLSVRRRIQVRLGRDVRDWYPIPPRTAERLLREAGFEPIASSGLLGPFAETRAFVAVPRDV
jgi:SAM-dependent methyltransferase